MRKSFDILRRGSFPLGRVGVSLLVAFGLTACATSQAPLDDAYYWPEKEHTHSHSVPAPVTANPSPVTGNPSPVTENPSSVEYLNVQDTTVTIRIKK